MFSLLLTVKEKVSNKNKDTEILFLPEGRLIPTTAKQEQMINNNIKADGERNQEISQEFIIYIIKQGQKHLT